LFADEQSSVRMYTFIMQGELYVVIRLPFCNSEIQEVGRLVFPSYERISYEAK